MSLILILIQEIYGTVLEKEKAIIGMLDDLKDIIMLCCSPAQIFFNQGGQEGIVIILFQLFFSKRIFTLSDSTLKFKNNIL